jgi:hypothetical protein
MNCFRVDYCGRGELAERQQKLNQFLMKLAHMAEGETFSCFGRCRFCMSCFVGYGLTFMVLEFNVCVLMVRVPDIYSSAGLLI